VHDESFLFDNEQSIEISNYVFFYKHLYAVKYVKRVIIRNNKSGNMRVRVKSACENIGLVKVLTSRSFVLSICKSSRAAILLFINSAIRSSIAGFL